MAVLLQVVIVSRVKAQIDPHFSQYYAYPLWLNPALTGVFDGDIRIMANYKDQWATINNAYQTTAVSADFKATNKLSIGVNILDESAGSAGFNYLTAYGSLSYVINVSDNNYKQVHFGVQAGIISRTFDINKLQLDDQYNPLIGYDPSLPSNENFASNGVSVFDAGAGIYYDDSDPAEAANIFGGVSLFHLNQPSDPFATESAKSSLPMRLTVHGGVRLAADEGIYFTPHFIYMRQQKAQEKDLGINSEFRADNNNAFILGAMYRFNDAAILDVGYHFSNTTIGLSYDLNTSALRTASNSQGGIELSISYVFRGNSVNRDVVCPAF
ncbi:type IX secretion system membrane protein, PorP/SprF family [Mucilaginibacter mallensis]|uniref:Type IX secretion system membrane protein, PorP/SprF family n=1 Tax=Mucilaginibacter mallensis TaxID=652787 RepID=A0A1H1NGJ7_MUCMA|nr:type IX secretion system membrane protein, PorP/SprF family [Mucilaginibacter mallensis]